MTKIRKYNGVYKLPIHKHTPVRYPRSEHIIDRSGSYQTFSYIGELKEPLPAIVVVKDISIGLENPLTTDRLQRDINAFRKKYPPIWPERKPSILTRAKERFKR